MGARRRLARFRIRCYSIYYACIRHRPLPVEQAERLTRFAFDPKDIRAESVHWRLFFSAKGEGISVIRTSGQAEAEVWRFGDKWVACEREKPIVGCVHFQALSPQSVGLCATPAEPPPRHAELTGWPADKEARRSLAQRFGALLAKDTATSVLRREPGD
jgi:hypothetical protein